MEFSIVKRGYDPEEVKAELAELRAVLDSYKQKDAAIKNAILNAQVAADNIIQNAKNQAEEFKVQLARELDKVRVEVDRERNRVQDFQEQYTALVGKYVKTFDTADTTGLYASLDNIEKAIDSLVSAVPVPDNTPAVEFKMPDRPPVSTPEDVPAPVTNEDESGE